MTNNADETVVRQQIVVDAPIEHAFRVFTERFGSFKPRRRTNPLRDR